MKHEVPLDHQLCFSLYQAAMAINRAYKPALDGLEITYTQYLVLSALSEKGPSPSVRSRSIWIWNRAR